MWKEESHEDPHPLENSVSDKILSKCASFSCSVNAPSLVASVGKENDGKTGDGQDNLLALNGCPNDSSPYPRSLSLPTPLKPLPALKGSREKHGVPLKKPGETWCPMVASLLWAAREKTRSKLRNIVGVPTGVSSYWMII
ncbi:hypothetical protein POM88_001196 [Heracleum sosnowskyi]|uniref:Uncharacterized protein n=1 Tax=Heracleum sosnowskyi TaxID=360622 RepID=A0AAD8JFN9_9APIA|nr:hypothetical protein POM88_001195 [Heracleum sosnowskyi]KAK1401591.1 hypothetical protein POM88_001196 [Heracleum sosnowskyi]